MKTTTKVLNAKKTEFSTTKIGNSKIKNTKTSSATKMKKRNIIAIITDHSASMRGLEKDAMNDFNTLIETLKSEAKTHGIVTDITHIECGVGTYYNSGNVKNNVNIDNDDIQSCLKMKSYIADGSSTPLYDAVGLAAEKLNEIKVSKNENVSYLVMVITDGQENSSTKYRYSLSSEIRDLTATDKWTFVFRVPKGNYKQNICKALNVPEGNVLEWETTSIGLQNSTRSTQTGIQTYYATRNAGQQSTSKFFVDLKGVTQTDVKSVMVDITNQIKLLMPQTETPIKDFIQNEGIPFKKGIAFYKLTKTEEVQDYKQIIIKHKKNAKYFSGNEARRILNIPSTGTIKLSPGDHGNFDIFVQSTSVNRKLPAKVSMVVWEKAVA